VSKANSLTTQFSSLLYSLRERGELLGLEAHLEDTPQKCKRLNNLSKINKLNLRVGKGRYKEWKLSPLPTTEFKVRKLDRKGREVKDE
jgi:hypothetical protein